MTETNDTPDAPRRDATHALDFARRAHAGQIDRSGQPYVGHVERVFANVERLLDALPEGFLSEEDRDRTLQVAALHDCVEDEDETGITYDDLRREGFDERVVGAVAKLDKRNRVGSYQADMELKAAEADPLVLIPKLGDNQDNGDPRRIESLPPERRSIRHRYERARVVLQAAYEGMLAAPSRVPG